MYWLVRKTPEQMLRLQNGRFDAADRLFFSVAESWASSTGRSNTDVKELIPEFFLPGDGEFLINSNNLPLGKRQNGQQARAPLSACSRVHALRQLPEGSALPGACIAAGPPLCTHHSTWECSQTE